MHVYTNEQQLPFSHTSEEQQQQTVLLPHLLPQPLQLFPDFPRQKRQPYGPSIRHLRPTSAGASEQSSQDPQEQLQDKWLSDRLSESVNWNRLSVDAAALSRVLTGAKETAREKAAGKRPRGPSSRSADGEILLELLRQSEVLADNLDQLLGLLHKLEREATAEGVGFGPKGWNLVMSTEQALSAAGAFAETLDEAASSKCSGIGSAMHGFFRAGLYYCWSI